MPWEFGILLNACYLHDYLLISTVDTSFYEGEITYHTKLFMAPPIWEVPPI
ncbi:hypothetical protein SAMN06265348_1204 [Pedobacter westerhofensis]|uniref:Uncharacterized protein n=1 Tax=Pedobacter westerhofensis TaxID=425512 RepID=A0A521FSJ6_9SPHI|nr:hypothetical protein SAMN06265348_1204 [Pedobacter westerhofensis]